MSRKRALPPDRLAECAAAHELFLARKNQLKLSQKKIAEEAGITPAAVNLYFKGINPLNAQFAAVLSRVLAVPVAEFSPRLAAEIAEMTRAHQPSDGVVPNAGGADVDKADALAILATPRSRAALARIALAANEGRLTEADLLLLDQIAARFESAGDSLTQESAGSHKRLRDKLTKNDRSTEG